uniref:Uncharacterized protein n=1 Tax=Arundo donax TaxID=35708 RepID=A0A0A9DM13_ARUDO
MRRRDGTMGKRDVTLDPSNMANLQMFSAVIELRYEVSSSLPSNTHEDKLVLVASKLTGTSSRAAFLVWF